MKLIRLKVSFTFDHCEIPAGTNISIPAGIAFDLINRGVAEMAEPEKAVIEPQENRVNQNRNNTPQNRRRMC
jgi:hypothetical protein